MDEAIQALTVAGWQMNHIRLVTTNEPGEHSTSLQTYEHGSWNPVFEVTTTWHNTKVVVSHRWLVCGVRLQTKKIVR